MSFLVDWSEIKRFSELCDFDEELISEYGEERARKLIKWAEEGGYPAEVYDDWEDFEEDAISQWVTEAFLRHADDALVFELDRMDFPKLIGFCGLYAQVLKDGTVAGPYENLEEAWQSDELWNRDITHELPRVPYIQMLEDFDYFADPCKETARQFCRFGGEVIVGDTLYSIDMEGNIDEHDTLEADAQIALESAQERLSITIDALRVRKAKKEKENEQARLEQENEKCTVQNDEEDVFHTSFHPRPSETSAENASAVQRNPGLRRKLGFSPQSTRKHPVMKRLKNGSPEQIAFANALQEVAERLTKTMRDSGFTVTEGIPPTQTATPKFKASFHNPSKHREVNENNEGRSQKSSSAGHPLEAAFQELKRNDEDSGITAKAKDQQTLTPKYKATLRPRPKSDK